MILAAREAAAAARAVPFGRRRVAVDEILQRGVGDACVFTPAARIRSSNASSILADPTWRPSLGPDPTTFRMVDLLLFAFEGREELLNPLGDG